jgi:RHS repeat-associated protein
MYDVSTNSVYFPRYTFSTKEYLSDAQIYLYAYRVYDPVAGRWTQRDPIDYQDSPNHYQFCGNNAVNKNDADGRSANDVERVESDNDDNNNTSREQNNKVSQDNDKKDINSSALLAGLRGIHTDYNKLGEAFREYNGFRFNNKGEWVHHTGKVVGPLTKAAKETLKFLRAKIPEFFKGSGSILRGPIIIIMVPPVYEEYFNRDRTPISA